MFKSKVFKQIPTVILTVALIVPFGVKASAVNDIAGTKSYLITNPYKTVNWSTWAHYKANLHAHSTVSDSEVDLDEMVEAHYALDYDILAMTDHGAVNRGWNIKPQPVPLLSYYAILSKPKYLTDARYLEITTGADRGGRGMTDVPFGIELNAANLTKSHVNSFFVDYGQNDWGRENDYETPIAAVDALGGLTHINHPGSWLESSKDINIAKDPKNIKFFADILKKYDSCLGIEVLNARSTSTRNDRVLWDGLLESVIPAGRNVWGFANSDVHILSKIDTSFEIFMMPENTVGQVRTAMENGTFFACGHYARRELGEDFVASGMYPTITNITVDDNTSQISIQGADYTKIEWVAKGEVIATGNTIDLNAYENQIGCYVRAQLLGPGGICMTQAFVTDDGSTPPVQPEESFYVKLWNDLVLAIKSIRIFVIFDELIKLLSTS